MPRFTNLTDTEIIKDTYPKINTGFANFETDVNAHFAGSADRHGTNAIINNSTVSGETDTDALNTLKGTIDSAVLAAANANIGVYSINASGTDTLTGTITDLPSYFGGLKINATIANNNTGAVTININNGTSDLGAKAVKKINMKGLKVNLEKQDLTKNAVVPLEYDGTDFIAFVEDERFKVINGVLHYYDVELGTYLTLEGKEYYGLEWNKTTNTYKRLGGAVDLVAQASTPTNRTPQNDFNNIYPWSDIKRCNLADDGTVNDYLGDLDYAEDGSNGQVMVEFPKFYSRYEYTTNSNADRIIRWYVSENEISGFTTLDKAFIRNGNNNDYYYMAAFEGVAYDVSATDYITDDAQVVDFTATTGDILSSIAGVKPLSGLTQSATLPNCRNLAKNRGTSWQLQDFYGSTMVQLLLLVEYANFNSQSVIGAGITGKASGAGNESENTGATSFLGNVTGRADGTDNLSAISYRGVENFWGNIWSWIDGINIQSSRKPWVADYNFASDTFSSPYVDLGVTMPSSNNYILDIHDLSNAFLPSEVSGSSTAGLTDFYFQSTGNRVARLGGAWTTGLPAGAWCWFFFDASSDSSRNSGARLAFIPNT
jgi:hypothetical protein